MAGEPTLEQRFAARTLVTDFLLLQLWRDRIAEYGEPELMAFAMAEGVTMSFEEKLEELAGPDADVMRHLALAQMEAFWSSLRATFGPAGPPVSDE